MPFAPTAPVPNVRAVNDPVPVPNDINLLRAAILELQQAGLLDLVSAKQTFVQTNEPKKLVFSDTDPNLQSVDEIWVQTGGAAIIESGFFADRSSSPCATVPPFAISGLQTLTSGGLFAGLAVNKETRTYSAARFLLTAMTTAPTDAYVVVYGSDGSVLGSTDSLVSQFTGAGVLVTGNLKTPIPLSAGVKVYLALVTIGGSALSVARAQFATQVAGATLVQNLLPNPVAVTMAGVTAASSGAPVALSFTTKTSTFPWIELV